MSEQENTAVVQQAYHNFQTGNIEGLVNQMSTDITWQLPEVEGVPLSGTRTGREGALDFFTTLARDQDVLSFEPKEFVAQGDKVISLGSYAWRIKETGREYASDFVHIFTIQDGVVTSFREHFDTAALAGAYKKAMSA
jgi:ketosteroid isomerase-like protein